MSQKADKAFEQADPTPPTGAGHKRSGPGPTHGDKRAKQRERAKRDRKYHGRHRRTT